MRQSREVYPIELGLRAVRLHPHALRLRSVRSPGRDHRCSILGRLGWGVQALFPKILR